MTPIENHQLRLSGLRKMCLERSVDKVVSRLERFRQQDEPDVWQSAKTLALHTSVTSVQVVLTRTLIAYGVDVDAPNAQGLTALMRGCGAFHASIDMNAVCLQLINAGAALNGRYDNKQTLLHAAVNSGLLSVSERLVQEGLDVNALCSFKSSPIHYAASQKDPRFALLLLRHGAQANGAFKKHRSPLCIAANNKNNEQTVLALVAAGARRDALALEAGTYQDAINLSPLAAGIRLGEAWLIEKLIDGDRQPHTFGARLRKACLQSDAAGKPTGSHMARALHAARLSQQWVREINASPAMHP